MARNGSGTYSLPSGNPVVTGTTISSTWANNTLSDIATALTGSLAADGQTTPTANIKMGGFKITNVAAGTAATDNASVTNVQNSTGQQLGTIAGTNTITAQATPTLTAYANGQTFRFAPAGTNTGATTLNIDSLGAKNVYFNGSACTGGEIPASGMVTVTYDGTQFNLTASAAASGAPFSDATAIIKNSSDATKLVKLSAASVSTGTTRTLTAQNKDATIAAVADLAFMPLTSAVATNALTATLASGALLNFNDGTSVTTSSALTVTAPSGQALGTVSGQASRIWVFAIKNSGTPELVMRNNVSGTSVIPPYIGSTMSTTAIAAAPSAQVNYSTTSRASQPWCYVGYIDSTQATAGTWAASPTLTQGMGVGVTLPGGIVNSVSASDATSTTGTTGIPFDDTIPQNTEGTQAITISTTPTSASNVLHIEFEVPDSFASAQTIIGALFQDSTANALYATTAGPTASTMTNLYGHHEMIAATSSSTTFKVRVGDNGANTHTFNGSGGGRKFGGVSFMRMWIREVAA